MPTNKSMIHDELRDPADSVNIVCLRFLQVERVLVAAVENQPTFLFSSN
jgi:hypothetical protein